MLTVLTFFVCAWKQDSILPLLSSIVKISLFLTLFGRNYPLLRLTRKECSEFGKGTQWCKKMSSSKVLSSLNNVSNFFVSTSSLLIDLSYEQQYKLIPSFWKNSLVTGLLLIPFPRFYSFEIWNSHDVPKLEMSRLPSSRTGSVDWSNDAGKLQNPIFPPLSPTAIWLISKKKGKYTSRGLVWGWMAML